MGVLEGRLVLPDRVMTGRITFGDLIERIEPLDDDLPGPVIVPGFVDVHVHGGGGADAIDGADGIAVLGRFHRRHGTTTLLPTTVTRPWPEVMATLRAVAAVRAAGPVANGPDIPGAHLEGPFISPHRLGAQPPFAIAPEPARVAEAIGTGVVRVVTIAPELDGATAAIAAFARAGTRVSLGHSAADGATADAALEAIRIAGGVAGGTHLFNAMTGIAGRAPGVAGALLAASDAHAELILDGHHVDPVCVRLARAALGDRLLLVTDAMRAAGLGDGDSELGGHAVTVRNGTARLADGRLAGSVLTMDAAFRRAVASGFGLPEASRLTATNAARYLGLADRGRLAVGLRADFAVLDRDLAVTASVARGGTVPGAGAPGGRSGSG